MNRTDTMGPISELEGVRLQVYCLLLRLNGEVGITQVQRAIGLKTASHAAYHLQKLEELGILERTPRNSFLLKEEYNTKSLKINALVDYYLFRGKFWPKSAFLASFVVFSLLTSLILIYFNQKATLIIFLLLSFLITLGSLVNDVIVQYNLIKMEYDNA